MELRTTIWADAYPPEAIPKYPTFSIKLAKGGEPTWRMTDKLPLGNGKFKILTAEQPTEPGEPLRDPELMLLPDVTDNINFRLDVLARCEDDPAYREVIFKACKSSIHFFINTFVSLQNPRAEHSVIPFVTFPYQDRFFSWALEGLRAHRTQVVLKSREMGFTWMAAAFEAWLSVFYPNSKSFLMSLREEDVDDRTEDSLFGKVRWILSSLPPWMRQGWEEGGKDIDKLMHIRLPENQSLISGILSKSTAGRGGRARLLLWDEAAWADAASQVMKAISRLSAYYLIGSTPNGQEGEFYRLCMDSGSDIFVMHYTDHPLKDALWKLRERSEPRYTEAIWAQEQELSFEGSTEGRVFPQFMPEPETMENGEPAPWHHVRDDEYVRPDFALQVLTGQDYGHSDPSTIVYGQLRQVPPHLKVYGAPWMLVIFDEFEQVGMTAFDVRYVLNQHLGLYRYQLHVGDARTGKQTGGDGNTWLDHMEDPEATGLDKFSKVFGTIKPGPPVHVEVERNWEEEEIETVRRVLQTPGHFALYAPGTSYLRRALTSWAYPIDKDGHVVPGSSPKHDHWSHICKAVIYLIMYVDQHYDELGETAPPPGPWNYPGLRVRTL